MDYTCSPYKTTPCRHSMAGFVYVATNECLPGLVKIGFAKDVTRRAKSLSNSSIPGEFKMAYFRRCQNARLVEKMAHALLDEARVSQDKEFFRCTVNEAAKTIEQASSASHCLDDKYSAPSTFFDDVYSEDEIRFLINEQSRYEHWRQSASFVAEGRLQWKGPKGKRISL